MNNIKEDSIQNIPYKSISSVLDVLDALVYVSDMETHEMIFMNQYGTERWGKPNTKKCWQILQKEQTGPCEFCTNHLLIDEAGNAKDVHVWEFQNTVDHRWYQCRDQAILWDDGRMVRLEIATDITDRIEAEEKLKNASNEAQRLARTDVLTNIRNRRALFEDSEQVINLAKRYEHWFSVVIIDIDHFKLINDKYGHLAGDFVLKSLAQCITDNVRRVDIFARFGGEEFALILPETELSVAIETAEKLRKLIENLVLEFSNEDLAISCSFGVTAMHGKESSFEVALSQADKALYQAKNKGRNCVEFYTALSHSDV